MADEWAHYVVHGKAPGGEIFQFGTWVAMPAAFTDQDDANGAVGEVINAFVDHALPAMVTKVQSDTIFEGIRVYGYHGYGSLSYVQAEGVIAPEDGTGTSSLPQLPLQSCIVASLRSDVPGRSGRGRMYVPITASDLNNHEYQAAYCTSLAEGIASWFNIDNANGAVHGFHSVRSIAKAAGYQIARIVVDSRPDIQRRRADREAIGFSSTAII